MVLNFVNSGELLAGLERIKSILDFEIAVGGTPVELIKGDKSAVSFKNGEGRMFMKTNAFANYNGISNMN